MNETLKRFYDDETMREEVYRFFKEALDEYALAAMYQGKDVQGVPMARSAIVHAEKKLQAEFASKPERKDKQRAQ